MSGAYAAGKASVFGSKFAVNPRRCYLINQTLPQQDQTIESISGRTYTRKWISLAFFVKKLILWSEGLFQPFLSDATLFVCRAVIFFNEIVKATHIRSGLHIGLK